MKDLEEKLFIYRGGGEGERERARAGFVLGECYNLRAKI